MTMKILRSLIQTSALLFLVDQHVSAQRLTIQSPKRLIDQFPAKDGNQAGVITASYANFGLIPYGHSMVSTDHLLVLMSSHT